MDFKKYFSDKKREKQGKELIKQSLLNEVHSTLDRFPWIECNDGFTISIQAGQFNYSDPKDSFVTEYNEFELGFPSSEESLLLEYAEDRDNPTGTVYGYVPVELINDIIEKHGGLSIVV